MARSQQEINAIVAQINQSNDYTPVEKQALIAQVRAGREEGTIQPQTSLSDKAGSVAGNIGGSYAANQAMSSGGSQAASSLAQTAAQNKAYNAAATAAGQQAAPTVLSNAAGMGALPMAGVAAGTYLVGKGLNDLRKGETDNSLSGKASRAQTAITTGGLSELARLGGFFGGTTTNVEQKKLEDLKKQGVLGADFVVPEDEKRNRGQQLADLQKSGQLIDPKTEAWLKTGDIKNLTGDDIQGYASTLKYDPRINDQGLAVRRIIGDEGLKRGIVSEGKGTIDYKADEDFNKFAEDVKAAQTSSTKLDELVALGKLTKEQAESLKVGIKTDLSNKASSTKTVNKPQGTYTQEETTPIENPTPQVVNTQPQPDLSALAAAYQNVSNQNANRRLNR